MMMAFTPELHVIEIDGEPRQRGQVVGESLRKVIVEGVSRWKNWISEKTSLNADVYLQNFLTESNYISAVERWTPDLLEEVYGIADGCGLDFNTMFSWQLFDEYYGHLILHYRDRIYPSGKCSTFGIWSQTGEPTLMGQTDDLPPYFDGTQTALRVKDKKTGHEMIMFTLAGMISQNGINNAGLGVAVNSLPMLNGALDGLPVTFIARKILEQTNQSDAIDFIKMVKHASGLNYTIGNREKVVSLECSLNKVSEYTTGRKDVIHTNHPLINDDFQSVAMGAVSQKEYYANLGSTGKRFNSIRESLNELTQPVTMEIAKTIFSREPVCVVQNGIFGFTVGCSIMELEVPTIHIAPGPPDRTPFQTFQFK